jgi:hypothetical protein
MSEHKIFPKTSLNIYPVINFGIKLEILSKKSKNKKKCKFKSKKNP